jgi:hypothetical protein
MTLTKPGRKWKKSFCPLHSIKQKQFCDNNFNKVKNDKGSNTFNLSVVNERLRRNDIFRGTLNIQAQVTLINQTNHSISRNV